MTENMICSWSFSLWPWLISLLSLWFESKKHRNPEQKSQHRKLSDAAKLVAEYVLSAFPIYFVNAYQELEQFAFVLQIAGLSHLNIFSDWASCHYPVSLMEMVGMLCPEQSDSTLGGQVSVLPWVSPCLSLGFPSRADIFCCVGGCVVGGSKWAGAWGLPPRAPCSHCCNICLPPL